MCPVSEAYKAIFGRLPAGLFPWQIAQEVVENFDGSKLDRDLARDALEHIVVFVDFPDRPTTTEVVGRAENMLSEVSEEYGPLEEVHMALVSRLMWRRRQVP